MDQQRLEQLLQRGIITQWEYDITLYFNDANVDIQIALSDDSTTSTNALVLEVRVHNRLDRPLPCKLSDSPSYPHQQILWQGFRIVDSNGDHIDVEPKDLASIRYKYPTAPTPPSTIPPQGCLVYTIRGVFEGNQIDFGFRRMVFIPGMQYRISYICAGIISDGIYWTAPSTK